MKSDALQRQHQRFSHRRRIGAARLTVQQAHLAEDLAGLHDGQQHLPPIRRIDPDPHPAFDQDHQRRAGISPHEDHFAVGEAARVQPCGDCFPFRRREVFKEWDAREKLNFARM